MATDNLHNELARLREMKNEYRKLDNEAKAAKKLHDEYQRELFGAMMDEGLLTIKTDDASYSRKSTVYAHVQNREEFHAWIEEMGMEAEFLRKSEESARVNELVRGLIDNGEDLPPGLGMYAREYISITE